MIEYGFDRYLRHDELVAWIEQLAAAHPDLVTFETYGRSYEGRDLVLVTVTDTSTGAHDTKPAHWIDASIHAVELTATVAACRVLQRLVDGHAAGDETITRALRTRTFYVVPRVNPDGAEWVLAERPRFRRSSVRPWPYADAHRWPGLHEEDVDGDGRILQMRLPDRDGPWMPHPDDPRVLVPVPPVGTAPGVARYRVLAEGVVEDFDGFSVPAAPDPEGLDLNRNYPAGWGTKVPGSGDHPLSEPEIDALVRAIVARPNICGFNAFHTSGGVILRPSSTQPDSKLPPGDVWVWKRLAEIGTAATGYPSHSVYEDFTWDPSETMSGASDDWAYEHLGIFGWTTEFWDVVHAATGQKQSTHFWYTGPTDDERLAVARWLDQLPVVDEAARGFVDWYPFEHPQLGSVELGGWNQLSSWTNPPPHLLLVEVDPHVDFAVAQALAAPCVEIRHTAVEQVDEKGSAWRVTVGVANTGWLPTTVSDHARSHGIVRPIIAELTGADVVDGPARRTLGQLAGASAVRLGGGRRDTPDRVTCSWLVRAAGGSEVTIEIRHERAGNDSVVVRLEAPGAA
ncbi:MAG TPA: M14 family metallopeptidase [Ilumatobacteraceae bacterium]|nr:M14 family metallopeptidase [Ilumatobacteraceae bacterium]